MQKAGKDSGGRRFELWLMANNLCGQLPINIEEARIVLSIINEHFKNFTQNELKHTPNNEHQENEPQKRLKLIETEYSGE